MELSSERISCVHVNLWNPSEGESFLLNMLGTVAAFLSTDEFHQTRPFCEGLFCSWPLLKWKTSAGSENRGYSHFSHDFLHIYHSWSIIFLGKVRVHCFKLEGLKKFYWFSVLPVALGQLKSPASDLQNDIMFNVNCAIDRSVQLEKLTY